MKTLFAEEDWNEPEQNEVPGWTERDRPMTLKSRKGGRKKTSMRYNRYGDDFLIDRIQPDEIGADTVSMGDLVLFKKIQIINDKEHSGRKPIPCQKEEWI